MFGLHAGEPVTATFCCGAPTASRAERRNPTARYRVFDKAARPSSTSNPGGLERPAFAEEAHELHAHFVAHVRHASTGSNTVANTTRSSKTAAVRHNGVCRTTSSTPTARVGAGALVHGDTDSERVFALVSAETPGTKATWGGLRPRSAGERAPRRVPLNLVLTTPTSCGPSLPSTHSLFVLERDAGARWGAWT